MSINREKVTKVTSSTRCPVSPGDHVLAVSRVTGRTVTTRTTALFASDVVDEVLPLRNGVELVFEGGERVTAKVGDLIVWEAAFVRA